MRENENAETFVNEFDSLIQELRDIEETFTDQQAAVYLLMALPKTYGQLRLALESTKECNNYAEMKSRIVNYFLRREIEKHVLGQKESENLSSFQVQHKSFRGQKTILIRWNHNFAR